MAVKGATDQARRRRSSRSPRQVDLDLLLLLAASGTVRGLVQGRHGYVGQVIRRISWTAAGGAAQTAGDGWGARHRSRTGLHGTAPADPPAAAHRRITRIYPVAAVAEAVEGVGPRRALGRSGPDGRITKSDVALAAVTAGRGCGRFPPPPTARRRRGRRPASSTMRGGAAALAQLHEQSRSIRRRRASER